MLAGGPEATALARDTAFAAMMIILTGIVGLCLLMGGARHREQSFGLHGVSASLTTLAAIVVKDNHFNRASRSVEGAVVRVNRRLAVARGGCARWSWHFRVGVAAGVAVGGGLAGAGTSLSRVACRQASRLAATR